MQKIRKRMWRRQQGFSLMELAVTIAIAAVIAAITIPGLLGMRQRYQLRASATDVLGTFKKAQSEAVKRNARVAVIITTGTPGICTVFVDDGAGGGVANNLKQDGTEVILFTTTTQTGNSLANDVVSPLPVVVSPLLVVVSPLPVYLGIEFNSGGIPDSSGTINITSDAGSSIHYRITLSLSGHVDLSQY